VSKASDLIAKALSQEGTGEGKGGVTKYGTWYATQVHDNAYKAAAWCDMFVSWCADQVGLGKVIGRYAYTPSHAQWFADNGKWGQKPKVGAIVFYDWGGSHNRAAIDHVGIVTKVRSDGRIQTIEGNTNDQVAQRVRDLSTVAGFGYPAYPGGTTAPKPSSTPRPLLKYGATGTHVKYLQQRLNAKGYHLAVDGVFGPKTRAAVRAFQAAHKSAVVWVDGEVGPKTWTALAK